jgi:radical SAM superfamily enzyme YgiQ (UPF0313 family)
LQIKLVSLEDAITSCGFRKMAAFVSGINDDTEAYYVSTDRYLTVRSAVTGKMGAKHEMGREQTDEVARSLVGADLVGFSSMSHYADLTHQVSARLRELSPDTYQVWGGIHPIIHPEDAITAPVDAICTGEGEFAFQELLAAMEEGRDGRDTANFWFKRNGEIQRNGFRPLMTHEDMEGLPFPQYGQGEKIYRSGQGFVDMALHDFLANDGLGYTTLWSIGCPFHCTYCGNTKFIANDVAYKKLRHPSARYIVDEVKTARSRFPHISQVSFHDDSFMAIPYQDLEEFAELWKAELDIPFAVYGVIPNYVKQDKFEILTWAGMNRIRMGIQSGSERILDFYKRPSPPDRILAAGKVAASFAPEYHIPPAYDIIMDNPIETRQDVLDTLELLYEMERPYTLLIYSLKVIPNTDLQADLEAAGVDLEAMDRGYHVIPPKAANLLLYVLALWKPPRWLWDRMLRHVRASSEDQRQFLVLGMVLRTLYLSKRVLSHVRVMDWSITPGRTGYILWRLKIVQAWQRHIKKDMPKPERKRARERIKVNVPIVVADASEG